MNSTLLLQVPRSGRPFGSRNAVDCRHCIASKRKSCSFPPFETLKGGSAKRAFSSWTGFAGLCDRGVVELSTLDSPDDPLDGIILSPGRRYQSDSPHPNLISFRMWTILKSRQGSFHQGLVLADGLPSATVSRFWTADRQSNRDA